MLAPDAVLRFDLGPGREPLPTLAGAEAIADSVLHNALRFIAHAHPVLVNGAFGLMFGAGENPMAVLGITVTEGRISELNLIADPAKLRHLASPGRAPSPDRRREARLRRGRYGAEPLLERFQAGDQHAVADCGDRLVLVRLIAVKS